jgi:hypothetical protein
MDFFYNFAGKQNKPRIMKTVIQVVLSIAIIVLGYSIYASIMKPIEFNKEKDARYSVAIQRLKDIRTVQVAYRQEKGQFTGSFDTLINFVKFDSFTVIRQIGDLEDSLDVALGRIQRDTIRISVLDSLFGRKYPVDSLRYIPFTSEQITMGAGEIETGSRVKVKVFEASMLNDILLKGLDEQLIINFNEEREKITGFPGLRVGSLTEATNNAGNWE